MHSGTYYSCIFARCSQKVTMSGTLAAVQPLLPVAANSLANLVPKAAAELVISVSRLRTACFAFFFATPCLPGCCGALSSNGCAWSNKLL